MSKMTMRQFAREIGVKIRSVYTDSNPHMENRHPMNHYKVRLRCGDRKMDLYYSMGVAIRGEPTVQDVLSCLASDAASVDDAQSFADWCSEYGYDSDSRRALRTYRVCQRQAKALRLLLGGENYARLLYRTERE